MRREPESGLATGTSSTPSPVSLSVVIPVYNEQDILAATVGALVEWLMDEEAVSSFEIIVAENGSTDDTREVAQALIQRYDHVHLLESATADYGAAMRNGFLAAKSDVIVNFDADYYDVEFVRRALGVGADVVVAAKGIVGSHDARVLLRRVVSRSFSMCVRRLLGLHTTETHGMKLFRRRAIEHLLPDIVATKDLFDTELIARAEWSGLIVAELPIRTEEMRHSRSGIIRRIPRTVWTLVKMRYRLRGEYGSRTDGVTKASLSAPR